MQSTDIVIESAREIADRLHLPFQSLDVLQRALTHRSYLNEHPEALEDNERLEFLGDAILDFLVAAWLYNQFPEMREGQMTQIRSGIVGTHQLAAFARQLRLGDALLLGHGENEAGGRKRDTTLCGTFEALIGAIYLDQGLQLVSDFFEPLLAKVAEKIVDNNDEVDVKSRLQEWAQSNGLGIPEYEFIRSHGPDHQKSFDYAVFIAGEKYAEGQGTSKQAASKDAARRALALLGQG